jgi:hypothetical protein
VAQRAALHIWFSLLVGKTVRHFSCQEAGHHGFMVMPSHPASHRNLSGLKPIIDASVHFAHFQTALLRTLRN